MKKNTARIICIILAALLVITAGGTVIMSALVR